MSSVADTSRAALRLPSAAARAAQVTAFVALWAAAGYLLPPGPGGTGAHDPNLFLLLGVPLTVGFQLVVRRRPLRELWVHPLPPERPSPPLRLSAAGWALAVALAALPAVNLLATVSTGQWVLAAWSAAALLGAVPAAYALRQLRRTQLRPAVRWLALTSVAGIAVIGAFLVPAFVVGGGAPVTTMAVTALESLILFVPVTFVLEEVTFRGLLDTHVAEAAGRREWPSVLLVSVLWALWHLPISAFGDQPAAAGVAQLLLVHVVIGVPMSYAWRRTGNLAVPALAHAVIDAVRNALLLGV